MIDLREVMILKVPLCKLYNDKYMIASTQIIFAFIDLIVDLI